MNWVYAAYVLIIVVVGCRIALWTKFKGEDRGRRLGISTLQLLVVIAAMAILNWLPNAGWEVLVCALAGIVALSFVPAKKTASNINLATGHPSLSRSPFQVMQNASLGSNLPGYDAVKDWFGAWPSFHDAEIIDVTLVRRGESVLRVYPYSKKPATVEFVLDEITDLELSDFSQQNVISSLTIETATSQTGEDVLRLTLSPCYGLAGRIDAKIVRLRLVPGKSPDGVSLW